MFSVNPTRDFEKEAKSLIKKYASLKQELIDLGEKLSANPTLGISLGKDCYKIKLGIKSKGKGKSGGARVITYIVTENKEVFLLTIYDKQVKNNISPKELDQLLKEFE